MIASTTYAADELMAATKVAKNFGSVLKSISTEQKEKIGVLRKNKLEAIVLPVKKYEMMNSLLSALQEYMLYTEVNKRLKTPPREYIDFKNILEGHNITL